MIEQEVLLNLLTVAINASVRAGKYIMDVYNSDDFQVNLKSDATPLTLADRMAHREIKDSLIKTRIPVLSEEGRNILFEERQTWEFFWMVDPLDGTKEFIKRNGEFTVNIALICNGYPDIGVVYVPVSGELYFALKGLGAYRVEKIDPTLTPELEIEILVADGQKLPLRSKPEKYTVVSSRSHPSSETQVYIDKLKSIYGEVEVYPRGSSMKICMVAEGNASIYPRFGKTTEWDTAAGQAIAEIAGCRVLTVEGSKRMAYNKEDLENPWFIVDRLE